jgi:two-component system cell cycle response regulator DivK
MKILAVDDNPTNLEIIKLLLRSAGHDVDEACDGRGAIEAVVETRPDLVFMDLSMPGEIDGLEATRRLKADPATRGVVVVAVTAMVTNGDHGDATEAGCDAFIRKPYTRKELLQAISRFFPAPIAT